MADRWQDTTGSYSFRFFSPEQADEILRDGSKRGRQGSHAAIERILKVEPGISRPELWKRLRQLKFPFAERRYQRSLWSAEEDEILQRGYRSGWAGKQEAVRKLLKRHPDWRPHVVWKRAAKLGLAQRASRRAEELSHAPWSEQDDQILLNLTGYKTSRTIAKLLHRSEAAVRCRVMLLGKSSRVHSEGLSRNALAEELHLGKRTIQRLIAEGFLEVRDPRITRESLDRLRASGRLGGAAARDVRPDEVVPNVTSLPSQAASMNVSRAQRVWSETAGSLGLSLDQVQGLIARGVLKLYDPRITEKSLAHFCRHHGSLINYDFLNRETKEWLESSMNLVRQSGQAESHRLAHLREHARIVRRCAECGRAIRGNAFFRHVRRCPPRASPIAEPPSSARPGLISCTTVRRGARKEA
jgi:hypothetical protein